MLHYALVFLIVAIIAAVLGFGGIAGTAAGIAKILDARLAGLHEKYRELCWAGGPGSGAAAEFAGEIAQLRMSLEEWGRYVRPEPAWRRPGKDTPDPFGTKPTAGPAISAPMRIVQ